MKLFLFIAVTVLAVGCKHPAPKPDSNIFRCPDDIGCNSPAAFMTAEHLIIPDANTGYVDNGTSDIKQCSDGWLVPKEADCGSQHYFSPTEMVSTQTSPYWKDQTPDSGGSSKGWISTTSGWQICNSDGVCTPFDVPKSDNPADIIPMQKVTKTVESRDCPKKYVQVTISLGYDFFTPGSGYGACMSEIAWKRLKERP